MPTYQRPTTLHRSAPSPPAPFSEHQPFPITFFLPRPGILQSRASGAHQPAPPLATPPRLHRLFPTSPPREARPGSAAANQAPPHIPASGPRPPEGSGAPQPKTIRSEAGTPSPGRGRGRGAGCNPPTGPGLPSRRPQLRPEPGEEGPAPGFSHPASCLSPRCTGLGLAFPRVVRRRLRRRRALLTGSSTTPERLLKSGRVAARPLAATRTRVSRPPDPDRGM